jgi:putative addiction module CopG family antidote
MRKTRSLSITLTHKMAKRVTDLVKSGDYATESEVIREGLRALEDRNAAFEQWLRTEGVARYDASVANSHLAVTSDVVRSELAAHSGAARERKKKYAA